MWSVPPFADLSHVPKMQPAGDPPAVSNKEHIICGSAIDIDLDTATWKCGRNLATQEEWDLTQENTQACLDVTLKDVDRGYATAPFHTER